MHTLLNIRVNIMRTVLLSTCQKVTGHLIVISGKMIYKTKLGFAQVLNNHN